VSITSAIEITFSRSITESEKQAMIIKTTPEIGASLSWDASSKTLSLIPQQYLQKGQPYVVALSSPSLSKQLTFTTSNLPLEQDQGDAQARADKKFADKQQEIHTTYPWIDLLPIQDATYFAYFDTDEKKIAAKVYPTTSSEEEIKNIQSEVLSKLQTLGVETSSFPIQWTIVRP
jgi:hypothetical protein